MLNDSLLDRIYVGDCRELVHMIPDGSVDAIFTDPPWSPDSIDIFGWLAVQARRILKPEGVLLTFCGKNRLDEVMWYLSKNLFFYWPIVGYQPESNMVFHARKILEKWRPALLYTNTYEPKRTQFIPDLLPTNRDKRFHEWGQGESFWSYYMTRLTQPGAVVVDPFCGGGTIPAVCKMFERRYIAFEKEETVAETARGRVEVTQPPLPGMNVVQKEFPQ